MIETVASRTALRVALRRAAHQMTDRPLVFEDGLALRIVAAYQEQVRAPARLSSSTLRAFLVARSRYAEELLAAGYRDEVTQYVILGAGLDTFAYRNPFTALRVFEVDHPATQRWKLQLLAEQHIAVPPEVTYVPVDFDSESLETRLVEAGFDSTRKSFFAWLGVVPYLTEPGFAKTVELMAKQPPGSGFVMDYSVPPDAMPELERRGFDSLAQRVAAAGEPFRLFFQPEELAARLRHSGYAKVEDLDRDAINRRYFSNRSDGLSVMATAGHLLCAWL